MRRVAQRGGPAEIVERGPDGALVPAGLRSDYMPVAFIRAGQENRTAIGFDVLSSADRATAVSAARVSGRVASTGRILLVQVLQANSRTSSSAAWSCIRTIAAVSRRVRQRTQAGLPGCRGGGVPLGRDRGRRVCGARPHGRYRACLVDTETAVDRRRLFDHRLRGGAGTEVGGFHHVEKLEQLGRSRVSGQRDFAIHA